MVTDADRLAADGKPVTIAGHLLHVRFTSRSFKLLEDRYGSIMKVGEMLSGISTGAMALFGPVFHCLSLGLRHETVNGQPVTEDWLLDNADPRKVTEYAEATFAAIVEGLPSTAVSEDTDPNPAGTNGVNPGTSLGEISITSPSFAVVSAPESSGTR